MQHELAFHQYPTSANLSMLVILSKYLNKIHDKHLTPCIINIYMDIYLQNKKAHGHMVT